MNKMQPDINEKSIVFAEYPYNMLHRIAFGKGLELPPRISKDIVRGIDYAVATLEDEEQKLIEILYVKNLSFAEASEVISKTRADIIDLESKVITKLRLPSRWNYIKNGVAGYLRKRINEEHRKAYHCGYCDGYKRGTEDKTTGIISAATSDSILDYPIEILGLTKAAHNRLSYNDICYIRDLVKLSDDEINRMRYLGHKKANEIAKALQKCGVYHTAWDRYLL